MTHRAPCRPVTASTRCGRVSLYRLPGRSVVIFTGEIDVALRGDHFDDVVAAVRAAREPVYVDCTGVTFFGAEGLRMLDRLVDAAVDGRLAAIAVGPALRTVARVYPIGRYTLAA